MSARESRRGQRQEEGVPQRRLLRTRAGKQWAFPSSGSGVLPVGGSAALTGPEFSQQDPQPDPRPSEKHKPCGTKFCAVRPEGRVKGKP